MESDIELNLRPVEIFDKFNLILKQFCELLRILSDLIKRCILPVESVLQNKTNTQKSDLIKDSIQKPTVSGLSEIAGLTKIKRTLFTLTVLPKQQPQLFVGRNISNSILLYGPPGTGKTRLVNGIAAETGAVLHSISLSDIMSSYVGKTEKNINDIFTHMKSNEGYSILFIDEIDGLCRRRNSSEQEYTRRIKTELMRHMSDIEMNCNLTVIAATNCPWDLDSAILRRFKKKLYIPLPDREERLELFQLFTKDIKIVNTVEDAIALVDLCEGLSGSDIHNLVQEALTIPLTELQDTRIWKKCQDDFYEPYYEQSNHGNLITDIENIRLNELKDMPVGTVRARPVYMSDFFEAIQHIQINVSPEDITQYEQFQSNKDFNF